MNFNCGPFRLNIPALALAALVCLPTAIQAKPKIQQDEPIVLLKQAFEDGNHKEFERISRTFSSTDIFRPYIDIWQFRLFQDPIRSKDEEEGRIWSHVEVAPLLERYDNTWAAEELRRDWLQQLARTGQFDWYEKERPKLRYRPSQGVECADMLYNANGGQLVRSRVVDLLTYHTGLAKTCRHFLRQLYDRGALSADDLNLRVYSLVARNQVSQALRFIKDYDDTGWGKSVPSTSLREASLNPQNYLNQVKRTDSASNISLAAALTRIAVEDPDLADEVMAAGRYDKYLTNHALSWLRLHLGYRKALLWRTDAEKMFATGDTSLLGGEFLEWKLRAILLNENWPALKQAISELPPHVAKDETWQYWLGRSLAQEGNLEEARRIWLQIAGPFSFYGKLAEEELGQLIEKPQTPHPVTAAELAAAKQNPGFKRALAFYDAGLRWEGFREFNLQTEQMGDRDLLAAANWAESNQLFDRAIAAADRTQAEHDYSLRYLTPFRQNMKVKAQEIGIEEAWVYGVIRQESRFITIARSHVGAQGLMQVMPATAKYVAKKIGMKDFERSRVNEIDVNLTLGINYLRIVLEGLDNSLVLASAGYNAGPGRPARWRRQLDEGRLIEGAIFAELIPFDETRGYVKNVMSNMAAYSLILGKNSISLKQKLGRIGSNTVVH